MRYSMILALALSVYVPSFSDAPVGTVNTPQLIAYESGNYIRSALFAEDIQHFDDLYLIHVLDGDVPIVIFCNRYYCYRPKDAERYT